MADDQGYPYGEARYNHTAQYDDDWVNLNEYVPSTVPSSSVSVSITMPLLIHAHRPRGGAKRVLTHLLSKVPRVLEPFEASSCAHKRNNQH